MQVHNQRKEQLQTSNIKLLGTDQNRKKNKMFQLSSKELRIFISGTQSLLIHGTFQSYVTLNCVVQNSFSFYGVIT